MLPAVAHDVRHRGLLPAGVDLRVAPLAGRRAQVAGRRGGARRLRDFFSRVRTQTADEEHDFPARVVQLLVRTAPGGHSRELDAVLDDVVQIAVREVLRAGRAQIRHSGIEISADRRRARAVMAVTNGAPGQEGLTALLQDLGRGKKWIAFFPGSSRYRQVPDAPSQDGLARRWLRRCTEATDHQRADANDGGDSDEQSGPKNQPPVPHAFPESSDCEDAAARTTSGNPRRARPSPAARPSSSRPRSPTRRSRARTSSRPPTDWAARTSRRHGSNPDRTPPRRPTSPA